MPPSAAATSLRGTETVLLVEDEEQVRTLAASILQRHGYQVIDATNAGEALLACEQHPAPIDLLITDVVMPRLSGPDMAERLRKLRPEMKVLFMSGHSDHFSGTMAALPAGHFLQKPLRPEPLLRTVRELLDAESRTH